MERAEEDRMNEYMAFLLRDTQHPIKTCRIMFLQKFPDQIRFFELALSEWLD